MYTPDLAYNCLGSTVYRKPTRTDYYLNFQSHHPLHIKGDLVRCLHDRAKDIATSQDTLTQEECHITTVLRKNGYPADFIYSSSQPHPTQDLVHREAEQETVTQRDRLL